jgi:hypothetical protein
LYLYNSAEVPKVWGALPWEGRMVFWEGASFCMQNYFEKNMGKILKSLA